MLSASFIVNPRPWISFFLSGIFGSWCLRVPPPNWSLRYLMVGSSSGDELCEAVRATLRFVDRLVLVGRLNEVITVDATDALMSCPVPIHYLRATQDRILGSHVLRQIQQVRPTVEVVDISGPHLLLQAEPVQCAAIIGEIVGKLNRDYRP